MPSRRRAGSCRVASTPPTAADAASARAWARRCAAACDELPSTPANGSSVMQRSVTCRPSRHLPLLRRVDAEAASSARDDDSPVPNSTRPFETRSSVARRSATRAGWLNAASVWMMPWPSRMFFVRWLQAARNTSGADECEYSSRKWCSTSQTVSKPSLSANSNCSSAFWNSSCSEPSSRVEGAGARRRCRTSSQMRSGRGARPWFAARRAYVGRF